MKWIAPVLLATTAAAYAGADPVSDAELISRANAVMRAQEAPVDRTLGTHKGVPVIIDIRCAGTCPQNTVRIIHYVIGPGPDCARLGGDAANVMVPISLQERPQPFCIPHALYGKQLYTDRPYRK
jgi:hypothetical protein